MSDSKTLSNEEIKEVVKDFKHISPAVNSNYLILIIDDDKWIHRLLCRYLNSWGFATIDAYNPIEGIAMAIKHRPMLIFLDIIMLEVNGDILLKMLKAIEITSDIPVIMVSGNLNLEILASTFRDGASGFVSKPFDEEILLEKLNSCIGPATFNKIREHVGVAPKSVKTIQPNIFLGS